VDVIYIVYLDDILIFSATEPDHLRDIREVLLRLRLWGLYCNPGKCELFVHSVAYLGFIVSTTGISMDPDRINAISQWPTPKAIVHVQEFLGFANYYRRFIEGYSSIVRPLTDILKGSTDRKYFPSPFL
jgi:reverse transcriptase-like protein